MGQVPTRRSRYGNGRSRILRILLVDDDPALRTLLRTTFGVGWSLNLGRIARLAHFV